MAQGATVARAGPAALAGPEDLEAKAERRAKEAKAEPPVRAEQAGRRVSPANLDSPANPAVTHPTQIVCRGISDSARILSTSSVSAKAAPQASNSWATAFTTSEIRPATLRSG